MKVTKIKAILASVVAVIFSVLGCANVFATMPSIALSPMSQRMVLLPGEEYKSSFSVVNPEAATEDLHYEAEVGSYSPLIDGERGVYGGADINTITDRNDIMKWIKIDNPEGTVAPNKSETLSFSIKVPENAPAGGQYATIVVKAVDDEENTQENSAMIKSYINIAYIIYAEVAGETLQKGSITENNLPTILTNNELKATSMVRNDGNIHTDAKYTLQVWPMFSDEELCTNEENPESSLIMPNTERYHVQTCVLPTVGIFKAKQVVKIFGEVSELEKIIIVCPIWLIFVVLFIIIALILWLVIRIKSHKKSVDTE